MISKDTVVLHFTNLTGSFNDVFCNRSAENLIERITADCGGPRPQVDCSCCTICCDDVSGECPWVLQSICKQEASITEATPRIADEGYSSERMCTCLEDGSAYSCVESSCPSCSEDGSICAETIEYGQSLMEVGVPSSESISFQYTKGRTENVTIHQEFLPSRDCSVEVNGEICLSCGFSTICGDRSTGIEIDCTNVIEGKAGKFSACGDRGSQGGVFEVLHMYYFDSYVGCKPIFDFRSLFED